MSKSVLVIDTPENCASCYLCGFTLNLQYCRGKKKDIKDTSTRACLKNHSRNLHAPLCGIFCPNSVVIARYDALIRTKSPTNCDAHLAESLFQTRSKPDWCPLMDLPEKDDGKYPANTFDAGFAEGRNECIDEITGGEVDDCN